MKKQTGVKCVVFALPVLWFLGLQLVDLEIFFRPAVFYGFLMLEVVLVCLFWPLSVAQRVVFALLIVSLWGIWRIPFTPRKAFLLRFQEISAGDTLGEVQSRLEGYDLIDFGKDGDETLIQILHSQDPTGPYNADVAILWLKDGIVTRTKFMPD